MEYIVIIAKIILGLTVINVWLFRNKKASPYRGGSSTTLKDEFEEYGISEKNMKIIGVIKLVLSILILGSIFFAGLETFAVIGMVIMMSGAIYMHAKVGDPFKKSIPATVLLACALLIWAI